MTTSPVLQPFAAAYTQHSHRDHQSHDAVAYPDQASLCGSACIVSMDPLAAERAAADLAKEALQLTRLYISRSMYK